jgi:DNA-binding transcriptional LysR family regulator
VSDHLASLRLFTKIVELGSFTRAADAAEISRASASTAIQELELRLGARLLERTTRHVRPTPDGQAFYERCVQVLADLEDAESLLRQVATKPRGVLRVDMHGAHATHIVLPQLPSFHERYPEVDLVISSGDRLVDLVREGVHCVIRAGTPKDSSLAVRRLAAVPQLVCASPEYLQRFGTPRAPGDLASHQAVGFFSSSGTLKYPLEFLSGSRLTSVALGSWVSVSDSENYVLCALRGCGLIQLPRFHVQAYLDQGLLVEVMARHPSPPMTISALYPYRRHMPQRMRVFIDWVAELYDARFGAAEK